MRFPPGPFAPLMAIQGMVTRTGWNGETWGANQRISVDEALRVYTWNGAYNSHEEHSKGSIAVGKLADFVVLSDDPHSVPQNEIKDIRIVRTVVGGRTTHRTPRERANPLGTGADLKSLRSGLDPLRDQRVGYAAVIA